MKRRMGVLGIWCSVFGVGLWVRGVWAYPPPLTTQPNRTPNTEHRIPNTPPAERLGDHRYRIGQVEVDTAAKVVQVPCRVNMRRGMIEFLAVASEGKLHESVLLAEAEPLHIHLALLLLGLDPGHGARYHGDLAAPSGPGVEARVEWQTPRGRNEERGMRNEKGGDPDRTIPHSSFLVPRSSFLASHPFRARLEEFAWDIPAHRPMPRVAWLFTGAMSPGPGPRMEEERSVVATYRDPGAVLTNPLPTGADDTVYKANERLVPPVGTPVTLLLRPAHPNQSPAGVRSSGAETRRG